MSSLFKSEVEYFESIVHNCEIVFDVGVGVNDLTNQADSYYMGFKELEAHYFEPENKAFEILKKSKISNKKFQLNKVGLSDENNFLPLYAEMSLYDRKMSGLIHQELCPVITGLQYCKENNIRKIDFLKIDVEGLETKVLKGFGDFLINVRYIQFEYGIGLRDAGSNLSEIIEILTNFNFSGFKINNERELSNRVDFWEYCNIMCENQNFSHN
jgi:FkbM family methyltransferase